MNRKQFIILLVLLVIIGAAGLMIRQHDNHSWQSAETTIGQKLLPGLAVNDVAQITIKSGTNTLNLAKRDGLWRVRERGGYPANFSQISDLLLKFAGLKIVQNEEVGPSQLGRFQLTPPSAATNSGTLVEFKNQSGKALDSILLGKKHLKQSTGNSQFGADGGWPDGRYVMVGTGTKNVEVISDPLDEVQSGPAQWLNKDFLNIQKPRLISVQFPEATNSWKLTRASETNAWRLADARPDEKLDSSKISSVTTPFSSINFNDVAPLAAKTSATDSNIVLTVKTFDGFTYVAKIGSKQNAEDDYPVSFSIAADLPAKRAASKGEKPKVKAKLDQAFKTRHDQLVQKLAKEKQFEQWIYYLPSYSVDEMLKPRGELLVKAKKAESAKSDK